jgi:hypothetical protein
MLIVARLWIKLGLLIIIQKRPTFKESLIFLESVLKLTIKFIIAKAVTSQKLKPEEIFSQ